MNNLSLAYLGDAVFELYIREYLINKKIYKVNDLQKESLNYITAPSQRKILENLINENILTEEEIEKIIKTPKLMQDMEEKALSKSVKNVQDKIYKEIKKVVKAK